MYGFGANGIGHLTQRRQVIEDPECSAVRRGDEVAAVHVEVANGSARQIELQRAPLATVVGGVPEADLGADEEQTAPNGILANRARVRAGRNPGVDARPRAAEVGRFP